MLVDYEIKNDEVTGFECYLTDWGIGTVHSDSFYSGGNPYSGLYLGGTPVYAGPRSFRVLGKDLFSFARLTLELFLDKEGLVR